MQLLTKQQVAEILGVHLNTVDQLRKTDPTFPVPATIGRRAIRWRADELERWVASKQDRGDLDAAARRLVAEVYG